MSAGGTIEGIGENIEFAVAAASDVTVYFNGGTTQAKTSSDDTATEKYTDTYGAVKAFVIRSDQSCQIVSINGVSFTDPITVVANKAHTEKLDTAIVFKMVIRTFTANTNLKLRVRGR